MSVRDPAVAGLFYPAEPQLLRAAVEKYISVPTSPISAELKQPPKAIIAPHAGYIYSGPIAGSAYAKLKGAAGITRVVLLSPAHRVPVLGVGTSSAEAFATPLGDVPLDRDAIKAISHLSQVSVTNDAHAPEHGIEVHLPFLQCILGTSGWKLVPLVVGEANPSEAAEVIDKLWGGPETLIVISSDLSHFYDYDTARELDSHTARAIESANPADIRPEHACGRIPLNGLLYVAPTQNLRAQTLDLRSSGDTAGDRASVVGYGAWAFS
jgi:MEMO1 family protein